MKFIKKHIKKIIIALIILIVGSTYFIGSYFVNYALVSNSGGENRPDKQIPSAEDKIISKRRDELEAKRDKWLIDIKDFTREVSLNTNDGISLYGHIYKQKKPSDDWMIIVHGYQSSEKRSQTLAASFYDLGYNILTYSLRAHDPSEGNYITMGSKDAYDLVDWVHFVIRENPNAKITLHGTSMGGATVINTSGMELPKNVKAIIDDCGYADLWEIFKNELKLRFNLPSFPVLNMANTMAKIKADVNLKDIKPIEMVKKSSLPILFIHTSGDDFVPIDHTYRMYDAKKEGIKEKYIIEGFGHADAVFADNNYFKKIDNFIRENSNKKSFLIMRRLFDCLKVFHKDGHKMA